MKVLVFKDIKNKRWTLWSTDRKKHLGYRSSLSLKNCEFFVDQEKQKKVAKSKKRFPHAWVIGDLVAAKKNLKKEVTYNPFLNKTFMAKGKSVLKSKETVFKKTGQVFI